MVDGDRDEWMRPNGTRCPGFCLPDYPNSIEAAMGLEDMIPEEKRDDYYGYLYGFVKKDCDVRFPLFEMIHATAEQRCKAWVEVMEAKCINQR